MQEEFNEFDLQMRSMLEDAEAKPSKRVWKGISARLDAAAEARGASQYGWMKWAGAALAFAAAIGAGFFFTGPQGTELQPQEVSLVAETVPQEPLLETAEAAEAAPAVSAVSAGKAVSAASAGQSRAAVLQGGAPSDLSLIHI